MPFLQSLQLEFQQEYRFKADLHSYMWGWVLTDKLKLKKKCHHKTAILKDDLKQLRVVGISKNKIQGRISIQKNLIAREDHNLKRLLLLTIVITFRI
jgi:hypothetical protein